MPREIPFEPGSGDVLGGHGLHVRNRIPEDEIAVGDALVKEGLDEALDDEMKEARRNEFEEE
jgi:hypothetical protein